jgi:PAS domain S-box-containing protein
LFKYHFLRLGIKYAGTLGFSTPLYLQKDFSACKLQFAFEYGSLYSFYYAEKMTLMSDTNDKDPFSGISPEGENSYETLARKDEELQKINRELENEIAERKRAEEQLEKTRGFLEQVFQSLPSMLIAVDSLGMITQWNNAAADFTGVSSEEAVSSMLWEKASFLKSYREHFERVVSSREPVELRMQEVHSAGEVKYFNIFIYPLGREAEGGAVIQIEDVTEFQKKDEYVRQAQKMDTVGNLASGLAHDFNNVIGGIKATLTSIRFSMQLNNSNILKLKEDIDKDLAIIEDSAQHGEDMVEQLRSLSKKKEKEFSSLDLIKTIKSVMKVGKNTFHRSIDLNSSFDMKHAMVKAYPTQLQQAILNLCVNASHAMTIMRPEGERDKGGSMTLSLERMTPGKHFSSILPGADQTDYWLLRIWDTGVGMDQEILSKIFDPFFTTKDKENGTGLGLSMVYNIIQQHKGFIEVFSEPGNGSIFNIFLPVDEEEEKKLQEEEDAEKAKAEEQVKIQEASSSAQNIETTQVAEESVIGGENGDQPSITVRKKKRIVFR